ncbi:MAG: hypothetical protein ABWZ25_03885 [Chitinophagaceae bacterium]
MRVAVTDFTRSILQKDNLQETSVPELQQLVERYPFFVAGRLLYLKKLQSEQSPLLDQELQKAEIWMPDTSWLAHLIFDTGDVVISEHSTITEEDLSGSETAEDHETSTPPLESDKAGESSDDLPDKGRDENIDTDQPDTITALENSETGHSDIQTEEPSSSDLKQKSWTGEEVAFDQLTGLVAAVTEEGNEKGRLPVYQESEHDVFDEMNRYAVEEPEELPAAANSEESLTEITDPETELIPGEPEIIIEEEEDLPPEESGQDLPTLRIAPYREEPVSENQELTFEPLHTVDYFASQGIQAREEDKPVDRLSQQLKSFTQWLKTMKRIPATAATGGIPEEKQIEEMAEHSIKGRDVWTEAMAEVWVKQGNPEKARLVYEKLSLLDPAKSVYFAAKIEQLKFL